MLTVDLRYWRARRRDWKEGIPRRGAGRGDGAVDEDDQESD